MDGETQLEERPSGLLIPRTGASMLANSNFIERTYYTMDEAFPPIDPGIRPVGAMVIVQIRYPKRFSSSGLEIIEDVRSTEYYHTQVAKVVGVGPLAFKSVVRDIEEATGREVESLKEWVSGAWYSVGDFVYVPKYGGTRFSRPFIAKMKKPNLATGTLEEVETKDDCIFAMYRAKDVLGLITADPLTMKCFLD